MLHAFPGVTDHTALLRQPWVGASWEGFVIERTLGALAGCAATPAAGFFRTSSGHEIDLVLDFGTQPWATEAKLTSQPSPQDMERLNRVADLIEARKRILVSQTANPAFADEQISCSLPELIEFLPSAVAH